MHGHALMLARLVRYKHLLTGQSLLLLPVSGRETEGRLLNRLQVVLQEGSLWGHAFVYGVLNRDFLA